MKNITKIRRYFHMYPEMSTQEFMTTKKIEEFLKKHDINYKVSNDKRGLVANINSNSKKSLAIVCDIDALPIDEENSLSYRSRVKNRMHACGHDANIAIVLDFLFMFKKIKNSKVNIYAIFQSDEEIARGAIKMKNQFEFLNGIDCFVKLHVSSVLPKDCFMIKEGPLLMGAEFFKKKGQNLKGRIKYFENSDLYDRKNDLKKIISDIDFSTIVKPVSNDPFLSKIGIYTLNSLGFKNKIIDQKGGDDFSFYIENKKGLYVFFGVKKDKINSAHHDKNFVIDDTNLDHASLFLKEFVENYAKLV